MDLNTFTIKAMDVNMGDLLEFNNAVVEVSTEHRVYDEGQCLGITVVKGFVHLDGKAYGPGETVSWPVHAHDLCRMFVTQCGGEVAGCMGCPKHD